MDVTAIKDLPSQHKKKVGEESPRPYCHARRCIRTGMILVRITDPTGGTSIDTSGIIVSADDCGTGSQILTHRGLAGGVIMFRTFASRVGR